MDLPVLEDPPRRAGPTREPRVPHRKRAREMTNHQVLATAILAGAACSAAFAQQDRGTHLRYGGRIPPAAVIVNGVSYPVGSPQTDVVDIVYDNGVTTPPPGAFNTGSLPRWHVMDDFSFNPGP